MSSVKDFVCPDKIDLKTYRIVSSDGKGNEKIEHSDKKRVSNSL